ncbi:MAG TPA: hypothetical protein VD769_12285 [Gaiellaceae bacterium]|nr:hypothetical protein [Gaiellaceae bacterium]
MLRLAPVVALVLALAACGGSGGGEGAPAPAGTAADQPAEGGVALSGQTLDGETLSLDEFRGKPLFVNVWASW